MWRKLPDFRAEKKAYNPLMSLAVMVHLVLIEANYTSNINSYIFLLQWAILLTVEIDGANIQLPQNCVNMCFENLSTVSLRQKLRHKWF